jgi:hypothetical protein
MAASKGTVSFNQHSLTTTRSDPAQQRREGIKVPDILAAEFSLLTGNGS